MRKQVLTLVIRLGNSAGVSERILKVAYHALDHVVSVGVGAEAER